MIEEVPSYLQTAKIILEGFQRIPATYPHWINLILSALWRLPPQAGVLGNQRQHISDTHCAIEKNNK